MTKCCAPNCNSSLKKSSINLSFHEFPKDPDTRRKWLANIGRPHWVPGRRSMICSTHFQETDLQRMGQEVQLLRDAVPTIFKSHKRKRVSQVAQVSTNENISAINGEHSVTFDDMNQCAPTYELNKDSALSIDRRSQHSTLRPKMKSEKVTEEMVFVGDTYSLGDCQLVESELEAQSSPLSNQYVNSEEPVILVHNASPGTNMVCYEDFVSHENIIIVESEERILSESPCLNSDNVLEQCFGQSETVGKSVINLLTVGPPNLNLSVASDESLVLPENSNLHVQLEGAKSSDLNKSKLCIRQIRNSDEKEYYQRSKAPYLGGSNTCSLSSTVMKGFVDLSVSYTNLVKECSFSDIRWQDGAFMCRLCGVATNKTLNLFSLEAHEHRLLEKIASILHIKIEESDDLPQSVCSNCVSKLDTCTELMVTSFNTHQHIVSVLGQDPNHSLQVPVYFHITETQAYNTKEKKRHVLLMEIHHEEDRPIEEYLKIASNDLLTRLEPQENIVRAQCNFLLAPISENCCVSEVEQARSIAEALIANEIIHTGEPNQCHKLNFCDDNLKQDKGEVPSPESTGITATELMPQLMQEKLSGSFEKHTSETQVLMASDFDSPRMLNDTTKNILKAPCKRRADFKKMQKLFFWQELEDGEVKLFCHLCRNHIERNCDIEIHLNEICRMQSQPNNSSLPFCSAASHPVQEIDIQYSDLQSSQESSRCDDVKLWKLPSRKPWNRCYQCSFCSVRLQSKMALKRHLTQEHSASLVCETCGFEALSVFEVTLHRQTCCFVEKLGEWQCGSCTEILSSESELKRHQSSCVHDKRTVWLCDACGKKYTSASKLNEHKKSHLPPEYKYVHQCSYCPKQYINLSRLKDHMQRHEKKKFMCKVCGKLFGTKQILRQHEFTHGDPQFLCSLCSRTFFRKSHLLKHMNVHDPNNTRINRSGPQPHRDGLNRCRECKKVFENNLLEHYKMSHPDISLENYLCEICKVENTSYAELFQHQREVHKTGVKDCPFCNKTIDGSTQMKYHLMRHEGMFPYNCPLCTNGYTANSLLQDHMRRKHTGEKPFECQQCSKRFPTSGALAQHSTVHSLPHQLLPCPICNQGFKRKAHLDVHLRTHTGEKPYPCPICDRPFRQRQDCVKHVRIIHGEDPAKFNFRFHAGSSSTFSQVVSVTDMELVLEGEDLMQTSL